VQPLLTIYFQSKVTAKLVIPLFLISSANFRYRIRNSCALIIDAAVSKSSCALCIDSPSHSMNSLTAGRFCHGEMGQPPAVLPEVITSLPNYMQDPAGHIHCFHLRGSHHQDQSGKFHLQSIIQSDQSVNHFDQGSSFILAQ
jgi:hypothetical protein